MERTSKEKKVFDCEGEANMLGYNGMLDRSARIKSGDKAEDGFDHNAFKRMLQDFSCVDFGSSGNVQLNASEAAEDESIYDAKIESEEREGNTKDLACSTASSPRRRQAASLRRRRAATSSVLTRDDIHNLCER